MTRMAFNIALLQRPSLLIGDLKIGFFSSDLLICKKTLQTLGNPAIARVSILAKEIILDIMLLFFYFKIP